MAAEFSTRLQYLTAEEMSAAKAELGEKTSDHFAEKAVMFFKEKAGTITPSFNADYREFHANYMKDLPGPAFLLAPPINMLHVMQLLTNPRVPK